MPKHKNSRSAVIKGWLDKVDLKREYFKVDNGKIFCDPCSTLYDFKQPSHLHQHIKGSKHEGNVKRHNAKPERQILLTENRIQEANPFYEELCEAIVAADIPFNKLSNDKLRNFLEKFTNKHIPDPSTLRKNYLKKVYHKSMDKIRSSVGSKPVWISVDETTDAKGRYVANVLVGPLQKDNFSESFVLMCRELEKTNNTTVTQLVLDACQILWPNVNQQGIEEKFLLFLTDAVPYMIKTGENLKNLYPNLLHVTCLAHGINRVAEEVRSYYPDVDKLIGAVKAVFKKAPSRILTYREKFPDLKMIPSPVYTRWGTWLAAAEFYASHYEEVCQVVNCFKKEDAKCIEIAQQLLAKKQLKNQLSYISANFTFLTNSLTQIQERNIALSESISIVESVKKNLEKVKGDIGVKVYTKLNVVLNKNRGYQELIKISKIIDGKIMEENVDEEISDCSLSPGKIAVMKYAPIVSVEAERSFSMHKAIFSDRRQSFTMENIEMILVSHNAALL